MVSISDLAFIHRTQKDVNMLKRKETQIDFIKGKESTVLEHKLSGLQRIRRRRVVVRNFIDIMRPIEHIAIECLI
jgi:hypothetical protein